MSYNKIKEYFEAISQGGDILQIFPDCLKENVYLTSKIEVNLEKLKKEINKYKQIEDENLVKKGLILSSNNEDTASYYYGTKEAMQILIINDNIETLFNSLFHYTKLSSLLNEYAQDKGAYVIGDKNYVWTARSRLGKICATIQNTIIISNPIKEKYFFHIPDTSALTELMNKFLSSYGLNTSYEYGRLD
jgi:hypothetical protein